MFAQHLLKFAQKGTNLRTEMLAGVTMFMIVARLVGDQYRLTSEGT